MCERAVEDDPDTLRFVPDHFKKSMCEKEVKKNPYVLRYVPDYLKTLEMCNEAVSNNPYAWNMFTMILRHKKPVRGSSSAHGLLVMSLITSRHKKCATRPLR